MKISKTFSGNYLSAADLDQAVIVTIEVVVFELVGAEKEELPVVHFIGAEKGMCLNKTNANTIAEFLGDEADTWAGKQIEIFPTTTDFGGKVVPCLRVRQPVAPAQAAAVAPANESSPF